MLVILGGEDYLKISQNSANELASPHASLQWLPHFVSIRSRNPVVPGTPNVWLSKVVEPEIRAYDRGS